MSHAAVGDLNCLANLQLNFTPPLTLTNTSAAIDATAHAFNCVSPNGNFPNLWSAAVQATGSATALGGIPCSLLLTGSGTGTLNWSPTGEKSKFTFLVNTNPVAGTITVTATVTSGPLKGDTVTGVPVVANPNVDCAINGLKNLTTDIQAVIFA